MSRRSNVEILIQRKGSLEQTRRGFNPEFRLTYLFEEAKKSVESFEPLDAYPVRAVAQAESLCRHLIREMIENSRDHALRAIELIAGSKPDYELLLSVSEGHLTFADIVAHTTPLSNLSSVVSAFEKLCNLKLSEHLVQITDRFGYASKAEEPPLIQDYFEAVRDVASVYALRHKICHEGMDTRSDELNGIQQKLRSFSAYFLALNGLVIQQLYPNLPRTQLEMNVAAYASLQDARMEMEGYITKIKAREAHWPGALARLEAAQSAWEAFVRLQTIMRHDPEGGGSIGPMLTANEAEELTRERTRHLKWYAEREEGDL